MVKSSGRIRCLLVGLFLGSLFSTVYSENMIKNDPCIKLDIKPMSYSELYGLIPMPPKPNARLEPIDYMF